ncbi:MAG: hypothetical protein ACYTGZ_17895 [Planctomycetota bacterium]|jgi:hypothetical protein
MKFGLPLIALVLVACSKQETDVSKKPPSPEKNAEERADQKGPEEVAQAQVIYYTLGRT